MIKSGDNERGLSQRDLVWLDRLSRGSDGKNLEGSSERGIRARLSRIRAKLGAKTTTQAVATALREGLIK